VVDSFLFLQGLQEGCNLSNLDSRVFAARFCVTLLVTISFLLAIGYPLGGLLLFPATAAPPHILFSIFCSLLKRCVLGRGNGRTHPLFVLDGAVESLVASAEPHPLGTGQCTNNCACCIVGPSAGSARRLAGLVDTAHMSI
jgi:hypothetical protein